MSLYGTMRTGVSGMNAQANRLGTVADNIANASTTGYKRASTEFSSMILPSGGGTYNSGGVTTSVRYAVSESGVPVNTSSNSDLAIDGNGFFIVSDVNGGNFLTRAGAFTKNGAGELINSGGFALMGYKYVAGAEPTMVVNSFDGMEKINVGGLAARIIPTTTGVMDPNLPANGVPGSVQKSSLSVYDSQGNTRILDFTYTKDNSATPAANTWTLSIVDRKTGTKLEGETPLTLTFDTNGKLEKKGNFTGVIKTKEVVAGGVVLGAMELNISNTTQDSRDFTASKGDQNGQPPSKAVDFSIDKDGIVFITYERGSPVPTYRLALADVPSPDQLTPLAANVYQQGPESGVITTSFANSGSYGKILSKTLEGSNVDMASELTIMIESQRSYTANSKVFQTGADLMDVLVNLKR
ncbi:flagellar hook protein FlgE [Rhizobium sp. CFBP 8762]|uniref:flagellar hook protein FlgE n=1 Tax=Rhizobium sp. CFBP 8762 TaxID=2775279 RepID=UPI00178333FE|nr:flagellar hook protein FlgE [Rhizobium sp. CFBP 8762]MBD8553450.1 flagellar hook protein FlgE [Rhizobium sp. CFBP 8762]